MSFLIIIFFSLYAFLEALSLLPRVAGSFVNSNSIGYSFSIMINTVKRVFMVAYPPLLGWMVIQGEDIFRTIYLSYFFGFIFQIIAFVFRGVIISKFAEIIYFYSSGCTLFSALVKSFGVHGMNFKNLLLHENYYFDVKLTLSSMWIYFVYGSSLFFVNILGLVFSEKSAVIYQSIGLVNALGTILMSFFLDPRLSRNFDKNIAITKTINSVALGQILAMIFLGPFLIHFLSVVLK